MKSLQQELLMLRTAERGNEAAHSALEVYLQLAEAEGRKPLLDASLQEIQSMKADIEELKRHNLPVDEDPGTLDRQLLSAREQRAALDAGIAQGWAKLQVLLGEEHPSSVNPSLEKDSLPLFAIPDRGEAVQTALNMRPELRTLRTMIHRITPTTLPVARAILQQYEGTLGTVQPVGIGVQLQKLLSSLPCLGPDHCPLPSQVREVEVRMVQLAELLRNRELAVTAEVDAALISWRSSLEKWEFAKPRVLSWEEQLQRLTQKKPVDETITTFDLAQARLGILEAKADLLKVTIECHLAQVKLWAAQGVVGAGCGLPGHEPFWCESCQSTHGFAQPEPLPALVDEGTPAAPAPKIVPMSGNFSPSAQPVVPFQSCRPVRIRR
jgi:hypothetical protein